MFFLANKVSASVVKQLNILTDSSKLNDEPHQQISSVNNKRTGRSSNNSMSSPKSDEDSDDKFFDAVDNSMLSLTLSEKESSVREEEYVYIQDDDDDRSSCFFDTATSRHQSEISDYSVINSPLSPRQIKLSDCFDEFDEQKMKVTLAKSVNKRDELKDRPSLVKIEISECNEDVDDEDQTDAELETPWSWWIDKCFRGTSKDEYEAGLKLIQTVKTVQTFWSIFNHIPDVSVLPNFYNYHLMRNTRRPLWEDPENAKGGLWKFKCKKEDSSIVWSEALLAAIGEQLGDCVSPKDEIIGISVGRREKEDIVQIWNLDAKYESESTVCQKIQQLVPSVRFSFVFYKPHEVDNIQNTTNNTSNSYTYINSNNYVKNNGYINSSGNNKIHNNNNFYNNNIGHLSPYSNGFSGNYGHNNNNNSYTGNNKNYNRSK